jgi:hypothetical protein
MCENCENESGECSERNQYKDSSLIRWIDDIFVCFCSAPHQPRLDWQVFSSMIVMKDRF